MTDHLIIYEELIDQLRSTGSTVTGNELIAMLFNSFLKHIT